MSSGAQRVYRSRSARGAPHRIDIRLPGRYNVANSLVALAILDAVGVTPEQAAPGLRAARVPGRLEPIDRGQGFLALVDYAHKPAALQAVLSHAARPEHRPAGGGVRRGRQPRPRQAGADGSRSPPKLADLVVITDDNPRDEDPAASGAAIVAGANEAAARPQVVEIGDRREAIEYAVAWARPGDVVLIAGKGHETGQTRRGQTRPFDDREELAAALRR